MSNSDNDLFPEIIVNKNAKEYVETDEEEEEEEALQEQNEVEEVTTLDPPKVEKEIPAKRVRKKKEIFQGVTGRRHHLNQLLKRSQRRSQ